MADHLDTSDTRDVMSDQTNPPVNGAGSSSQPSTSSLGSAFKALSGWNSDRVRAAASNPSTSSAGDSTQRQPTTAAGASQGSRDSGRNAASASTSASSAATSLKEAGGKKKRERDAAGKASSSASTKTPNPESREAGAADDEGGWQEVTKPKKQDKSRQMRTSVDGSQSKTAASAAAPSWRSAKKGNGGGSGADAAVKPAQVSSSGSADRTSDGPVPSSPSLGNSNVESSVPTSVKSPSQPSQSGTDDVHVTSAAGWESPASSIDPSPSAVNGPRVPSNPPVNVWQMRKELMAPKIAPPSAASSVFSAMSSPSMVKQVSASKGEDSKGRSSVKGASKKSTQKGAVPPPMTAEAWPDVRASAAQTPAADTAKAKNDDASSVVSSSAVGTAGKKEKLKWTPIPKQEMQEALDKAEQDRRQKAEAARTRTRQSGEKKAPTKSKANAPGEKAASRAPTVAAESPKRTKQQVKPETEAAPTPVPAQDAPEETATTTVEPVSERASPAPPRIPLSNGGGTHPAGSYNASRVGRGGRGGRGGMRGGRGPANGMRYGESAAFHPALSPGRAAQLSLPSGGPYAYGYYPAQPQPMPFAYAYGSPPNEMYFPTAAPPPPLPMTQAFGLDPLRTYILGQLEYYFSMQNLAMDFFLRQQVSFERSEISRIAPETFVCLQMDSNGWVDISMIACFNRIKNLTEDVTVVKEAAEISAMLEVRDDKLRLANGEYRQWVLPDAKPSAIDRDNSDAAASAPAQLANELNLGVPGDLSDEARGKIQGDVQRDVLRSHRAQSEHSDSSDKVDIVV